MPERGRRRDGQGPLGDLRPQSFVVGPGFFGNGWVRLLLVVGFVLAGILAIANLIDDHRPPGFVQEPEGR